MGRSLQTSLFNLGLNEVAESRAGGCTTSRTRKTIYDQEPDAGLGNGGLGRLAACYLDGYGYGLHPRHRLLHPVRVRHLQAEDRGRLAAGALPTTGCPAVSVWLNSHPDQAVEVRFDGQAIRELGGRLTTASSTRTIPAVIAVPNDMYVAGYGSNGRFQAASVAGQSPRLPYEQLQRRPIRQRHQQKLPTPSLLPRCCTPTTTTWKARSCVCASSISSPPRPSATL